MERRWIEPMGPDSTRRSAMSRAQSAVGGLRVFGSPAWKERDEKAVTWGQDWGKQTSFLGARVGGGQQREVNNSGAKKMSEGRVCFGGALSDLRFIQLLSRFSPTFLSTEPRARLDACYTSRILASQKVRH